MSRLVVVGDALLDIDLIGTVERICPDAPAPVLDTAERRARPGGAALAAALAAAAGHDVTLLAPAGDDDAGRELAALVRRVGVRWCALAARGRTRSKTRVRAAGQSLVRIDNGDLAPTNGPLPDEAAAALAGADAVLVADYGAGTTAVRAVREALAVVGRRRPVVWDPHRAGAPCTLGTTVVLPNGGEVLALAGMDRHPRSGADGAGGAGAAHGHGKTAVGPVTDAALGLLERWRPNAVAVTLSERGALLVAGTGAPLLIGTEPVRGGDACGAGDCFAAAATAALAGGAVLSEAVAQAVAAAGAFVARGTAWPAGEQPLTIPTGPDADVDGLAGRSGPTPSAPVAQALADRVRRAGGTVVVAGGCFDILHRGHVELLRAARRLGDCLIVALNSDRSVRTLKGPDRPILAEGERSAILSALSPVDAVATFDEPTPERILTELRPHLFVKGGDYAGLEVPEQAVLAGWGGRVVTVPYLSGRSTSRIVEEVRRAR